MGILQNSTSSGYGYGNVKELTDVPGIVARAYRNHKFQAGIKMLYPYPWYLWNGRTELTEVPGTGINVVQNSHMFFVG